MGINDGSTDKTREIVEKFQEKHSNLKLLNTQPFNGGRGKSVALNAGLADFLLSWRGLEVKPRHRWSIGVLDSDAAPKSSMLKKVSFQFNQQDVGGVQTPHNNYTKELTGLEEDLDFKFELIMDYYNFTVPFKEAKKSILPLYRIKEQC